MQTLVNLSTNYSSFLLHSLLIVLANDSSPELALSLSLSWFEISRYCQCACFVIATTYRAFTTAKDGGGSQSPYVSQDEPLCYYRYHDYAMLTTTLVFLYLWTPLLIIAVWCPQWGLYWFDFLGFVNNGFEMYMMGLLGNLFVFMSSRFIDHLFGSCVCINV